MMWLSGFEILWFSGLDMMWLSGFEMLWFSGLDMWWLSGFEMRWLNGLETRWPNGGGDLVAKWWWRFASFKDFLVPDTLDN